MKIKEDTVRDAMYDVGYQYTAGVHTHANCLTEGCDNGSRGGLYCRACAVTRLAEVSDPLFAAKVASIMDIRMQVQGEINALYEEADNDRP